MSDILDKYSSGDLYSNRKPTPSFVCRHPSVDILVHVAEINVSTNLNAEYCPDNYATVMNSSQKSAELPSFRSLSIMQ